MDKATWQKHLDNHKRSGLSVAAYCREHGPAENSFRYRQKRGSKFIQVSGHQPLELTLQSGAVLRFPGSQLRAVLKALGEE